jgi:predicted aldo/keto reductase-like oxidoreductase
MKSRRFDMDRRKFIGTSILGGTVLSLTPVLGCGEAKGPQEYAFPRRKLGKTGEMLSIIGFGGILVDNVEQTVANDMVAKSFERGINYYDIAPTYGNAQDQLGPALAPYRNSCFLACKTTERGKEGAANELHESLNKLQTDYFDLYQLHAITTREDVERVFAPNGAMEVFLKAREEGKVRFLGFSAHSEEAALLAMGKFDFDTALFPLNFVCWHQGNFGPGILAKAKEKNMGILALKALAFTLVPDEEEKPYERLWYKPIEDDGIAKLSLRFTLSQGTTAAIPPGDAKFFWKAVDFAQNITTITSAENEQLAKLSEGVKPLFRV